MSDIAIRVSNLSKQYTIGGPQERYKTLRDTLAGAASAPFRRIKSTFQRSNVKTFQRSDEFWALKDVSFEVRRGEVVGIIGRNGAGKSTLLKILSRITEPTEGRAELRGRVGTLLEVGTGFHPELTGQENIFLNGTILGMKRAEIERKFDEIVAFAEVERFIDTPVKHYSSGMYLRLAFAVAAHLDPEILIVDEVLAVGDAQFQKKCLGKMEDVARQGRTVLFVSHNMAAIRTLCTDAILLRAGQIELAGPTEQVISHYLVASAEDLSTSVELPRSGPGAAGQATRLGFGTIDGRPQAEFRLGEPWRLTLEFELSRPVEQAVAAVGITTIDSFPIITYWSQPNDLPAGRYSVTFTCDLPLAACDLQFAVGLSTHGRAIYYVPRVGHVSISEIAQGEQPLRASGSGLLRSVQASEIVRVG
ncbi:MAG: ATP-binding cassette domain-containing protein [Kouleothrix sp.]|nr:ATP-binding cassette domain-containing protein [Kouleothrix sp.]